MLFRNALFLFCFGCVLLISCSTADEGKTDTLIVPDADIAADTGAAEADATEADSAVTEQPETEAPSPEAENLIPEADEPAADDAEPVDNTQPDNDTAVTYSECAAYNRPQSSATMTDENLKEISGIAVSYKNPGIIWTHNDSGGKAALFAIGFDGKIKKTLTLTGATNIDWEALALMPCGNEECLYIADTGDNLVQRSDYSILVLKEPLLSALPATPEVAVDEWEQFPIAYSDGPHNTEAMAVHPNGSVYLFTKEIGKTVVFTAPQLAGAQTTFTALGEIKTGTFIPGYPDEAQPSLVTAADIHRNGTRLIIRMYGIYTTEDDGIIEFRVASGASFNSFLTAEKLNLPEGADMQGEAISYDPVTGGYAHTSEYYKKVVDFNPNLYRISCK